MCFLLWALLSLSAAAASFDPSSYVSATNSLINDIGTFVGLGADLHAYEGAKPLSTIQGLDVGVSATAIALPGKVVDAFSEIGIKDVPHYIPVPKVNIQKALPGRLMIGSEFIPTIKVRGYQVGVFGADLQWTAIDRPRLPAIAIRGQYNYSDLVIANASTYGADALMDWPILFLHLYGGAGYRFVKANVANPTGTVPAIPGVNFETTSSAGHFFAGSSFVAGFVRLTAEADLTTKDINTYGTKLSFCF